MDIELKDFFSDDDDNIMTIATQSLLFKRENEELPTDTSSSRFGPTITVAELAKQRFTRIPKKKPRSSGAVVVKLLACWQEVRGSIPGLASTIPEIGNLLRGNYYYLNEKMKSYQPIPLVLVLAQQ